MGRPTSLQLSSADRPVAARCDCDNENLKLAICGGATCLVKEALALDDGDGKSAGAHVSLQLNSNDAPVILRRGAGSALGAGNLVLLVCGDSSCSTGNTATVINGGDGGVTGVFTSLQLNGDGNPVISHFDLTSGPL